jgi:transcription elongation factor GreA
MSQIAYVTEEGLRKLKEELHFLKTKERPSISNQIAEARDKGDLSENAEYDAAKEAQGLLELKISKLEDTVSNARIIDESKLDSSKVLILSKVKLKNLTNKAELTYTLVPEQEADLKTGRISVDSPIGKGLLGKKVGEMAEIKVPSGMVMKFEILEVNRG